MIITPEVREALRQVDVKTIAAHPETAYAYIVELLSLLGRADKDLKAADAFSALCKANAEQAQERIKILERHKSRLLANINHHGYCPGNGWLYDWDDDEKECFPIPDEYIGRPEQCRTCWEVALEADQ